MMDIIKVAELLEELANIIDGQESVKVAEEQKFRYAALSTIASKYKETTGSEMPTGELEKLAHADDAVLESVQKLLGTQSPAESLGSSVVKTASTVQLSKEEARQRAFDRFGAFLSK